MKKIFGTFIPFLFFRLFCCETVVETSASGGYMEDVTLIGVADPQKYERKLLHTV